MLYERGLRCDTCETYFTNSLHFAIHACTLKSVNTQGTVTIDTSEVPKMSTVSHPAHYNKGKIEVIEFIEDQGLGRPFCRGNAIKYLSRAGKKDPNKEIEDLEKARWYIQREVELIRARSENRDPVRPNDMNPKT